MMVLLILLVGAYWACDSEIDNVVVLTIEKEPVTELIYSLDDED